MATSGRSEPDGHEWSQLWRAHHHGTGRGDLSASVRQPGRATLAGAIAFSPSTQVQAAAARYAKMRRPFLSITGTLDGDVLGTGATPESRARLWDLQAPPDKYRAVYVGGDHAVFGGGGQGEREWMRALGAGASASTRGEDWGRIQASVQRLSLAFLDAYLKEDAQALVWLREKAGTELAPLASWAVK